MNGMGAISVRLGKSGTKERQAEQVYGGLFCPGPDPAELRAWVADDAELGKRVADDFLSVGRWYARNAGSAFLRGPAAQVPARRRCAKAQGRAGKGLLVPGPFALSAAGS